jgi:signal transduction histidine kinase/CheY-like chemotaxis protein
VYTRDTTGGSVKKIYKTGAVILTMSVGILLSFEMGRLDIFNNDMLPDGGFWSARNACVYLFPLIAIVGTAVFIHLLGPMPKKNAAGCIHASFFHLYQYIVSNLDTGILVLDSIKNVKYINPACCRILQKDVPESPENLPYSDFLYPVLVPIAEKLATAIEANDNFSREFRVFLPEGIKCVKCDLVTYNAGWMGLIHVLSFEDKTAEDEIKQKLSAQLEENNRNAASKDNFFANMSHEIRTPINAILGMTYFAKNLAQDPRSVEYIEKIENASNLLLGVVNDILDFSKMREHKFSLKPEKFNLSDLKKILLDLFTVKAKQKELTLSINFDCPGIFYVNGDQFRLTQIFMNLIGNAIKFTDKGFVSAFLNHEIIGNDVILRCTVRDTGCGLTEEDIFTLFTDFAQFGEVLNKSHEGTGLGLAISKRLVELMNGVIWVDSVPGKGSIFRFIVVLSKCDNVLPEEELPALPRIERASGRVLVVEDNEINAEIAGTLLLETDYTAEYAFDGLEAIEKCRFNPPGYYDLVLMDIHMPRMNGYDAARILKEELHLPCPILAVTATSESKERPGTQNDYIAGYILKPYNPGVFKALFGRK